VAEFLQQLLNGLSLGAIYALIALGYTMVYGVLRFINFAHSDVFMVGAFIGYYTSRLVPAGTLWGGLVVLLAAMLGCAILGIVIERLAYRPLRGGATLNVLITAIGVSLLLEYTGQVFFGAAPRTFTNVFPSAQINLGELVISTNQLIVIVVAVVLMIALQFIVYRTKIGTAMRAVSVNARAAQLVGVNNDIVISFTFGLGSARVSARGGRRRALRPQLSVDRSAHGRDAGVEGVCRRGARRDRQHSRRRAGRADPRHGRDVREWQPVVDVQGRDRVRDPDWDPALPARRTARQVHGGESMSRAHVTAFFRLSGGSHPERNRCV
jgi:branched-chain amino acid transport system permease protein